MGIFRFRNGKVTYFHFRYRYRIITVFSLRVRIRIEAMLKLLLFFELCSVPVSVKAYKFVRTLLQPYQNNKYGYYTDIKKSHYWS